MSSSGRTHVHLVQINVRIPETTLETLKAEVHLNDALSSVNDIAAPLLIKQAKELGKKNDVRDLVAAVAARRRDSTGSVSQLDARRSPKRGKLSDSDT